MTGKENRDENVPVELGVLLEDKIGSEVATMTLGGSPYCTDKLREPA